MSNFALAADPIRPWNTLLSNSNQFRLRGASDGSFVLDGNVSGLPATIEVYGSGFGNQGAGLLAGTAQVNVVQYTVAGQAVMRADNTLITGPQLTAWLRGDGNAFEQAVFVGDAFIALSNAAESQNGCGGNDVVHGRGGNDFGRGGEELGARRAAGVPCEVVPGVTAALACAAATGSPPTRRDHARTVTFATGHTRDGRLDLGFAALTRPGQILAIYMGVTTLAALRDGLVAAGLPAGTPAALVERGGGTDAQRVLRGTFATVAAQAPAWHAGGPAMLLVGDVAAEQKPMRLAA